MITPITPNKKASATAADDFLAWVINGVIDVFRDNLFYKRASVLGKG